MNFFGRINSSQSLIFFNMTPEFKVGETVYLRLGNKEALRVCEIRSNGVVLCSWENQKDAPSQPFHPEELEKEKIVKNG